MSYHPAKFSGHRHSDSDSRDIMIFVCHVTLQDHVIRAFCGFMVRSFSSHYPIKFGGHTHCGREDIIVLACYMMSQDHVIGGSYDFISSCTSR